MGYCHDSNYKFNQNGWRIAYIEDNGDTDIENDNAVIISAGAPECLNNITEVDSDTATIISKYCNNLYIKNGTCDASVIDNNYIKMIDDTFFSNLTDNTLDTCSINGTDSEECGSNNDLISVGGFYWFKTASAWNNYFMQNNFVNSSSNIEVGEEGVSYGIRPILMLDSSVVVTGGTGLYGDPYIISK